MKQRQQGSCDPPMVSLLLNLNRICKVSKSWLRSSAGRRAEPVVVTQARSPKIAWLAEKRFAEKHPVHGFLAECSSQYVHFSAYQAMRGVTKGLDGSASYSDEFQRDIDSGFALVWLTELLIDCFIPSRTWVSPEIDFQDKWLRHWPTHMSRIQRDLRAYGLPALMYAADLVRPPR